jgi:protein MBA1
MRRQTAPTAVALHREMYSALADGDVRTLRSICTDGIYERFEARIQARKRGEKMEWELVRYDKGPKVVSHKGARLPIEGAAVRQAVVRICSTQRLTRYAPDGQIIKGTGEERKVVEYVVIQKSYWDWKGRDWQIWGTTGETKLEAVQEWERKALAG